MQDTFAVNNGDVVASGPLDSDILGMARPPRRFQGDQVNSRVPSAPMRARLPDGPRTASIIDENQFPVLV